MLSSIFPMPYLFFSIHIPTHPILRRLGIYIRPHLSRSHTSTLRITYTHQQCTLHPATHYSNVCFPPSYTQLLCPMSILHFKVPQHHKGVCVVSYLTHSTSTRWLKIDTMYISSSSLSNNRTQNFSCNTTLFLYNSITNTYSS